MCYLKTSIQCCRVVAHKEGSLNLVFILLKAHVHFVGCAPRSDRSWLWTGLTGRGQLFFMTSVEKVSPNWECGMSGKSSVYPLAIALTIINKKMDENREVLNSLTFALEVRSPVWAILPCCAATWNLEAHTLINHSGAALRQGRSFTASICTQMQILRISKYVPLIALQWDSDMHYTREVLILKCLHAILLGASNRRLRQSLTADPPHWRSLLHHPRAKPDREPPAQWS